MSSSQMPQRPSQRAAKDRECLAISHLKSSTVITSPTWLIRRPHVTHVSPTIASRRLATTARSARHISHTVSPPVDNPLPLTNRTAPGTLANQLLQSLMLCIDTMNTALRLHFLRASHRKSIAISSIGNVITDHPTIVDKMAGQLVFQRATGGEIGLPSARTHPPPHREMVIHVRVLPLDNTALAGGFVLYAARRSNAATL